MSAPLRLTVGETTLPIKGWAKKNNVPEQTIHARLRYGWPPAEAVGEVPRSKPATCPTQKQLRAQAAAQRKEQRRAAEKPKSTAQMRGCRTEDLEGLREGWLKISGAPRHGALNT